MSNEATTKKDENDNTPGHNEEAAQIPGAAHLANWSAWAAPIEQSPVLTPEGRVAAHRAVASIRRALGEDFLQRALAIPGGHPIFSLGHWPANQVIWVYVNLFQLAAQFELLRRPRSQLWKVTRSLQANFDPTNWTHGLLQLEVASLGLQAGWHTLFEPALGTGRLADLRMDNGSATLLVETTSLGFSVLEQRALAFFHSLTFRVLEIEMRHNVHLSGQLCDVTSPETVAEWFQKIEVAAAATAGDGISRSVSGPAGGLVQVSGQLPTEESVRLNGALVETDPLRRMVARMRDKANQTEGASPVWLRIEDLAGLWMMLSEMTLEQKLVMLTPILQSELDPLPHIAGIVLSPGATWSTASVAEFVRETWRAEGATALRCPLPGHRERETLIVPRSGSLQVASTPMIDWYAREEHWLNWALEQLGFPPPEELLLTAA
jgi:hypothetical protein